MRHPSFLSKLTDHSDVCVAELEIRHRPSYFQLAPGSTAPWWIVHTWSYIIASFILIHLAGFSLRWLPPAAWTARLNRLCTGCGGKLRPSFSLLARKLLGTAPVVLSNWEPLHRTLPHLQSFQWCLGAKDPFCLHFWSSFSPRPLSITTGHGFKVCEFIKQNLQLAGLGKCDWARGMILQNIFYFLFWLLTVSELSPLLFRGLSLS